MVAGCWYPPQEEGVYQHEATFYYGSRAAQILYTKAVVNKPKIVDASPNQCYN